MDKQRRKQRSKHEQQRREKRHSKGNSKQLKTDKIKALMVKSPSDTTIYAPALVKAKRHINMTPFTDNQGNPINQNTPVRSVIDKISDFVDRMRIQSTPKSDHGSKETTPVAVRTVHEAGKESTPDRRDSEAERLVIEAEKFKASVNAPTGEIAKNLESQQNEHASPGNGSDETLKQIAEYLKTIASGKDNDGDDEFFHISCHVEHNLRVKIECGEFVELDKLLPKNRAQMMNDEKRLQIIQKNGETFLGTTSEKEFKINSYRKWDQAFRVYASIYSQANPERSTEIWQYIHVISTAASSYAWENVAYYDTVFRQLMAKKPKRNWGKTYNQLWNLAMCDHLNRNTNVNSFNQKQENPKVKPCWWYNKGSCKKWNCKYEHRCSVCNSFSHIYPNCPKKKGKGDNQEKSGKPPTTQHKKQ